MSLLDSGHNVQSDTDPANARRLLWLHIFGDQAGRIGLFSGIRNGERLESPHEMSYVWPEQAQEASDWIDQKVADGRDTFMCAHLLTDRKRVRANAAPISTLYADGDGAIVPDHLPAPSAIVRSSRGREQLYWRLSRPIDPLRGEELNRRLAYAIGADPSGWDLTQLLRPPGTPNRKYPEAPAVKLVYLDDVTTYDPDDLERILPLAPPRHARLVGAGDEPPVRLTTAALETWNGIRPASDRSGTLWAIAKELYRAGATVSLIAAVLPERDETIHTEHPEGPKYAGRPDAMVRYLETAQKAAAAVEAEPPAPVIVFDQPKASGADPDCRRRVAELEDENRQLSAELKETRELQRLTMAALANPNLEAGDKITAVVIAFEAASARSRDGDKRYPDDGLNDDGSVTISRARIAERAGITPDTAGRQTKRLAGAGLFDKDVTRVKREALIDAETGEILRDAGHVSEMRITIHDETRELLAKIGTIEPPGGRRRGKRTVKSGEGVTCPEHPNAAVKVYRVEECADCGREIDRRLIGRITPDIRPDDEITPADPRDNWRLERESVVSNAAAPSRRHPGVDSVGRYVDSSFQSMAAAGED